MKNKKLKRPGSKKKLLVLSLALALLFIFSGLVYFKFIKNDSVPVSQEEQNVAEQADVDAAKQKVEEDSQSDPLKDDDEIEDTPSNASLSLSNLAFNQSGGVIEASVSVSGVESGGCSFIFTDADGRAITKKAQIAAGACSVSTSEAEFSMIGEYNLTAKVGDETLSKTVTIN